MSHTSRVMNCAPEDVFEVLDDGWSFAGWVVGAARIRDVDANWPAAGSQIHHSVGGWPVLLDDTTSVVSIDRPHELVLTARAWPTGEGRVTITCTHVGDGTRVDIEEHATKGPARLVPTIVMDPVIHARNDESLRRLAFLSERAAAQRKGELNR